MRNSPFAVFRRNQRQLMVVLTGLAMFAFIFLDDSVMRAGQLPRMLSVIFVALVCAGGLWVLGAPRGKGNEWALYGAILGALVAFFGLRAQSTNNVVASTSIGNFTRTDLQEMAQRRAAANRFVFSAATTIEQATKERLQVNGFGGVDDPSLVQRAILLHEAKSRGISVSDEAVLDFIKKTTDDKLALPDYHKILRELGLPEAELFNIIREELSTQLALQMDLPPAQQSGMAALETPLTYWKEFQMLQVRQSLEVAAVPVAPFVASIPEPKDTELTQWFNGFKDRLPTPDGQPGFLQDRQVNIGYVVADFEAFEKNVTEPTAEEIAEFYEANKDQLYRVLDLPDSPSTSPFEDTPASAVDPENLKNAAPALPTDNAPTDKAPADNAAPADNSPPAPSKPEEGAARSAPEVPIKLVSFQAETDSKPAAEPATKEPKTETPASEPPATKLDLPLPTSLTLPPAPGGKDKEEVKYRELDDNLQSEIRDRILRTRAFDAMGIAVDKALDEMAKLGDKYLAQYEPEKQAEVAKEITAALKQFAADNRLEYKETGPMTQNELFSSTSETIGSAQLPSANPFQPGVSVAQEIFDGDTLYSPMRADSVLRDKRYAYWKIADIPAHTPEFKDVRDKVAEAWKIAQARPRAQQRAEELAEMIRKSGKPPAEALSGQTVTGSTDSDAVTVRETPRFSWLNMPRNLPFQFNPMFMPPPELSPVEGVEGAGQPFMQKVFEELGPGDVGVALNQTQSVYYVVRVKQRDAAPTQGDENLGLKALQQQFLTTGRAGFGQGPYMYLNRDRLIGLFGEWRKNYDKTYQVQFNNAEANLNQPE